MIVIWPAAGWKLRQSQKARGSSTHYWFYSRPHQVSVKIIFKNC